jgi:hypothetical protein
MANPIFIEYYTHENSDCYKVRNPWTNYAQETLVLCKVDAGIEKAKELCEVVLREKMLAALNEPIAV